MDDRQAAPLYAGVEIAESGTRMTATVSASGLDEPARRATSRLPAPPLPDDALRTVAELVRRLVAGQDGPSPFLAGVGVAVWGHVDPASGAVRSLPLAPQWSGYPFAEKLSGLLGAPVSLMSAVNAGAVAEVRSGVAKGAESLFYAHGGRTVSSAYAYRGMVVSGVHGAEGGLGHVRVRDGGARCSCGRSGHLETFGSAQSIVRNLIGLASDSEASLATMHRLSGGRPEAFTIAQAVAMAQEGDPIARRVLDDAAEAWGSALAVACALLDPEIIALTGPLSAAGDPWLAGVSSALAGQMPRDGQVPRIVWAGHPLHGPLLGARLFAEDAPARG